MTTGTKARHQTPAAKRHAPEVRPFHALACTFAAGCVFTAALLGHVVAFAQDLSLHAHPWPLICLSCGTVSLLLQARSKGSAWGSFLIIAFFITGTAIWFASLLLLF